MKTIKTCFCIATLCIVFLTGLAGYLLISNNDTNDSIVSTETVSPVKSSNKDSTKETKPEKKTDTAAQNIDKFDNDSFNTDSYKGLLDSIVYNVTLAVNSINNILSSGSIFLGIFTIFIGLVGLFGYHHLKEDLNKRTSEAKDNLDNQIKAMKNAHDKQIDKAMDDLNNRINEMTKHLDKQTSDDKENLNNRIDEMTKYLDKQTSDAKENLNNRIDEMTKYLDKQTSDAKENLNNRINEMTQHVEKQTGEAKENLNIRINEMATHLNNLTDETKENLKKQINDFSITFKKADSLVESAEELKQSLVAQQSYIDKSNESLIQSIYSIANRIQDEDIAKRLLSQQSHLAEIINLYRPCINPEDLADVSWKKQAALLYFQANGTKDDLCHLQYVAENDRDPKVRSKAQEVIIRIELRSDNENNVSPTF